MNLTNYLRNYESIEEMEEDFGGTFQPTHKVDGIKKMKTHSQIDRNKKKPVSERVEKERYYDESDND